MSTVLQDNCASYAHALLGFRLYTPGMALRIKELRKRANLTQQQLADLAGIERSQLSKIENEREPANTRRLSNIANALGVSINDLFTGDNTEAGYRATILAIVDDLTPEDREAALAHARALAAIAKANF